MTVILEKYSVENQLRLAFSGVDVTRFDAISPMMKRNIEKIYKSFYGGSGIFTKAIPSMEGERAGGLAKTHKSPDGSPEVENFRKGENMVVGHLTVRKSKEGKEFRNLELNLPFFKKEDFYVVKDEKQSGNNPPDYILFHGKQKAGAMWKKESDSGDNYLSGSLFFPGMVQNRLYFSVFTDKENKSVGNVIVSEGKRKESVSSDSEVIETESETVQSPEIVPF